MSARANRIDRRKLFRAAAVGTASSLTAASIEGAAMTATPAPEQSEGRVEAPSWIFQVHLVQDPYSGEMQLPQELQPGTRYVGAEVEVINDADQPLNFTPIDIRLRDGAGVEHRGGQAIGTEPMINPRNLNPGERSRGWVWFVLPQEAEPVEMIYVAPSPQFRVPLPL